MADTKTTAKHREIEEEYSVVFRNGGLEQLKEAAHVLGISEDDLGTVLMKGVKFIILSKNGKVIIDEKDATLEVDLSRL